MINWNTTIKEHLERSAKVKIHCLLCGKPHEPYRGYTHCCHNDCLERLVKSSAKFKPNGEPV